MCLLLGGRYELLGFFERDHGVVASPLEDKSSTGIYHLRIIAHSAVALFAVSASTWRFLLLVKSMRAMVLHVVAAL
jgi:hypothetical protein